MSSRLLLSLLVVVASLPAAAIAGTTVVYGPGLDAADAAAQAKDALGSGDFTVAGALADLVGGTPEEPRIAGAEARRCGGSSAAVLGEVLAAAREEIIDLKYTEAGARLNAAYEALPCGAANAAREDLWELFFLQGFMEFNAGRKAEASAAFVRAAAIDRSRAWPKAYPPTAKTDYLEALQKAVEGEPASLGTDRPSLKVDGDVVRGPNGPSLVAGGHLLVVEGRPLWIEAEPGAAIHVTTAGGLVAGLLAGDDAMAPWLADLAGDRGWGGQVLVVGQDGSHLLSGGRFEGRAGSGDAAGYVPGIGLMAAGGAMLGAGLGVHLSAFQEADLAADGSVGVPRADYPHILQRNKAGLGVAVAGGAMLGVGIGLTVVQLVTGAERPVAVWAAPGPAGLAFGIGGTLP